MGLWSLITFPIRSTYRSIIFGLSILALAFRISWTITTLVPLFTYMFWVSLTTFLIVAAHRPDVAQAVSSSTSSRTAQLILCATLGATKEVPHYLIFIKVAVILYAKLWGVLGHTLGFLFMLVDLANIVAYVYNYAENILGAQELAARMGAKGDERFSMAALISASLTPVYAVAKHDELCIYKSVDYYDVDALREEDVAAMAKIDEGLMDIYVYGPKTATLKPVIMMMHGGAWVTGTKDLPKSFNQAAAERGFLVVSINYRLAPKYPQPAGFRDVELAMSWIKRNIAAYGGDKDAFFTAGDSAGGHLALLAAIKHEMEVLGSVLLYPAVDPIDHFGLDASAKPFFVNDVCGGNAQAAETLAIVPLIKSGVKVPPSIAFHGDHDTLVPLQATLEMQKLLKNVGQDMRVIVVPHATHIFMGFNSPRAITVGQLAADWALDICKSHKKSQ